jgi:transposase
MDTKGQTIYTLKGPAGEITISAEDHVARRLAMLFEAKCLGVGIANAAEKYGYSEPRYYQIQRSFREGGSDALRLKKTGPKSNFIRTENVVTQVVRHRFLDPDANCEVIAQKLCQSGVKVSQRSVERVIEEFGIQKKAL